MSAGRPRASLAEMSRNQTRLQLLHHPRRSHLAVEVRVGQRRYRARSTSLSLLQTCLLHPEVSIREVAGTSAIAMLRLAQHPESKTNLIRPRITRSRTISQKMTSPGRRSPCQLEMGLLTLRQPAPVRELQLDRVNTDALASDPTPTLLPPLPPILRRAQTPS